MTEPHPDRGALLAEIASTRGATAYFLRQLSLTSDDAFEEPSALPGWTNAAVIADVAYQARGIANCIEGLEDAIDRSAPDRAARILFGATLSPIALRNLAYHSAVHLNVVMRDVLEAGSDGGAIALVAGQPIGIDDAIRLRTETLWLRSLDLGGLASLRDAPDVVPRRLIERLNDWAYRSDVRIVTVGRGRPQEVAFTTGPTDAGHEVRGTTARIGRWAAGRAPDAFELEPPRRAADLSPASVAQDAGFVNAFAGA